MIAILGWHIDVKFVSLLDCQIIFLENHLAFASKSHECVLKLTDLWITGLLFDLTYELFNGSFAFSPG